jgi:hypothetical protein
LATVARIGRLDRPLTITCGACRHSVTWPIREAIGKLGGGCMIPEAKRRLRCSRCGGGRIRFVDLSA